ncbi:MAG: rod shape-determining protein RodA [Burkholderiales bacterium]|jgi:rod shape determining protein RodA|nr:rod shape-determining protein RodA [Burkholderiales bacterium]
MIERVVAFAVRHVDPFLAAVVAVLMGIGLVVLYSASGESFVRVGGQLMNMAVALSLMWLIANVHPQRLAQLALPLYAVGLLLLLAVAVAGEVSHGARRWLHIGVTRIQPSELMKLAVPLMLAWYFDRYEAVLRLKDYAIAAALLLVPVGLIAKQPDLGTALLVAAAGFYALFLAGLSWKLMVGLGAAGAAALPFAWGMLHDYQRQRVLTLLDPTQDPLGKGYHTIQSSIALGSGGVFGKGWLNGTQARLDFLPERTTDFVFAVYAEEFGLIGNLVLLVLFLLVIGRGLYIAAGAPTLFTRLLAGAVTLTFFTYAFVNMGMVSGILPVVGVPLPLISYGGTSLVTLLCGIGILMSVHTHKRLVKS